MNSPEEKAGDILDKVEGVLGHSIPTHSDPYFKETIEIAVICVDEIIEELEEIKSYIDDNYIYDLGLKVNYWQKVKEQIQKLQP